MLTLDLDMNLLSGQMERFVEELGMDGPTVVRTQGRLLIETLIRITPPHTLSQGRKAVARDVRNALGLFNDAKYGAQTRVAKVRAKSGGYSVHSLSPMAALTIAMRKGDIPAANAILRNLRGGPLKNFQAATFSKGLHTGVRNARGRVTRSQRIFAATPAAARARLRKVQALVGQAKGAFLPALHAVGGSAPGWIERQGGKFGAVEDVQLDPGQLDPRLTVINNARGMRALDQRDVDKTLRLRERAMKTHIAKLLELRAKENHLT